MENSKNYGVYNTIYDEIIRTEDIAGLSDAEYDLAVFLDKKIKGLERKNLFEFSKSMPVIKHFFGTSELRIVLGQTEPEKILDRKSVV